MGRLISCWIASSRCVKPVFLVVSFGCQICVELWWQGTKAIRINALHVDCAREREHRRTEFISRDHDALRLRATPVSRLVRIEALVSKLYNVRDDSLIHERR